MGNEQGYLIPANSKKSMLILGFFNPTDLVIFITGCVITFFLLMVLDASNLKQAVLILTPALIGAFLVLPIPNHHNVRTFIINIYTYYSNRKIYYWRGWCINYGKEQRK